MPLNPLGASANLLALYQAVEKLVRDKVALNQALESIESSVYKIFLNDTEFVLRLLRENQAIATELTSARMDKRDHLVRLFKDAYDEAPGLSWTSHHENLVEQFVTKVSEILLGHGVNETQSATDYLDDRAQGRHDEAQRLAHQSSFEIGEALRGTQLSVERLTSKLSEDQQRRQETDSSSGSLKVRRLPASTSSFTGRAEILGELSKRLYGDVQVIHGLGGVGKTQTAVRYALTQENNYDVIWRVRSGNSSSIVADLAELAVALRLAEEKDQTDKKLSHLRNWLSANSSWLLIFDDLQEIAELHKVLTLEPAFQGKVLITSRSSNWGNFAESIPLDIWVQEESIQFLKSRLKGGKYDNDEKLKELGNLLGNLPLALEQAAAYINATPSDVQAYNGLFTERRKELWRDKRHETHPDDYPYTVATTWTLSIEKMQADSLGALPLLQVCSFFAPDDIPLSLFVWGKEILPEPLTTILGDTLILNQALAALSDYSLLSWQDDFLSVHQLVQAVVRDSIEEPVPLLESILKLQLTGFPFKEHDSSTWEISQLLVRHMSISSKLASQTDTDGTLVFETMSEAVRFLRFISDKNFESTLPTLEQMNSNTVEVVTALGEAMSDREKSLRNTLQVQQQILDTVKEKFGTSHWRYAFSSSKLGHIYSDIAMSAGDEGAIEEAEALHREALAIMEAKVKANEFKGIDLVYYLHSLAKILLLAGKRVEAKQHLERCLEIVEVDPRDPSSYRATIYEYLGYALINDETGKWAAAKYFRKARELAEALGMRERFLINTFNLATSLAIRGREFEAENYKSQVIRQISQKQFTHYVEQFVTLTEGLPPSDLTKDGREALKEIVEIRKREEL